MMSSRKLTQLSVICWVAVLFCQSVQSQLQVGFYTNSCRRAELIVRSAVRDGINKDRGVAAGLVRMHFHDCFVRVSTSSSKVIFYPKKHMTETHLNLNMIRKA